MRITSLIEQIPPACDSRVLSSTNGHLSCDFERCLEWVRLASAEAHKHQECAEKHRQRLRSLNETESRLQSLSGWRETDAFTELEKAALSLSEAISLQEPEVISQILHQDLRRHFSNNEIIHLTLTALAVNDWIAAQLPPIRVLVIEDNADDQELLHRQLAKTHMADNVLFVADGLQAMEIVEKLSGPDSELIAIFLDLHLPGLSGIQILERIRAMPAMQEFPVIVMTSSQNPHDLENCRNLEVFSYVPKPITYESFSHAVANIFHSRPQVNQQHVHPITA